MRKFIETIEKVAKLNETQDLRVTTNLFKKLFLRPLRLFKAVKIILQTNSV